MDNQHKKITGYRDLSQEEIDLMNRIKALGNQIGELIDELLASPTVDHSNVEVAKVLIQTGMMSAIRAVARPTTFC